MKQKFVSTLKHILAEMGRSEMQKRGFIFLEKERITLSPQREKTEDGNTAYTSVRF